MGQRSKKLTLIILLLTTLAVVLVLPQMVPQQSVPAPQNIPPSQHNSLPADSASARAEKRVQRLNAQQLLAEIIPLRDQLVGQQVDLWASAAFDTALQSILQGDQRYALSDYRRATDSYQRALEQLQALIKKASETLHNALNQGAEYIEQLDHAGAAHQLKLAAAINAELPRVKTLARRHHNLPQIIQQLPTIDQMVSEQQFAQALLLLDELLKADPDHQRLSAKRRDVEQAQQRQLFNQYMSRGYVALKQQNFHRARQAFEQAATVQADAAVDAALQQLTTEEKLFAVNSKLQAARDYEQREQWQSALTLYHQLLQQDPSLVAARARQIPVSIRADLDRRLLSATEDPLQLSDPDAFRTASNLLQDARGISRPGPRLHSQITALQQALDNANRQVEVLLLSDNLTEVTLFRIAQLGSFDKHTVTLKPGRYIVQGIRPGYRDVQVQFTVDGSIRQSPIVVRCTQPI